jgi:hypothetical protein
MNLFYIYIGICIFLSNRQTEVVIGIELVTLTELHPCKSLHTCAELQFYKCYHSFLCFKILIRFTSRGLHFAFYILYLSFIEDIHKSCGKD